MAVREIIRMGHPTLRQVARPLVLEELSSRFIDQLIRDMVDTLHQAGGIGLAAPQVNESLRLAIIEIPGGESRYGEIPAMPLTVFVNPEIEVLDGGSAGCWEGCLSVPGLRGFVERPQHIRVRSLDLRGNRLETELHGFFATVLQHEFDHLDGKLYLDRLKDTRLLVFEDLLNAGQAIAGD
ncbi:MAG TPA: peptide deformylase [Xanthomonadales bacterium]|nr:peptide deformylase [Xanthomonadales bacterium]